MEPLEVAQILQNIIKEIGKASKELTDFVKSEELPKAERDYQKAKELACVAMRQQGMAIGLIDMQLKGKCSDELYRRDMAELRYKALNIRINVLTKQLNGYQSVNKYLENV